MQQLVSQIHFFSLFEIMHLLNFLVYCVDLRGLDLKNEELIALTRDHLGRTDPDALLNGFFPVWAAIQFIIACKLFERKKTTFLFIEYSRLLFSRCCSEWCMLFIWLPNTTNRRT
jgi:hypothetical protein